MAGSLTALELAKGQLDMQAEMADTCRIERQVSKGSLDSDTARYSGGGRDLIFEGPCSVYPIVGRRDRTISNEERHKLQRQYRVMLPHTAVDINENDIFTTTTSQDLDLIGLEMTVRDAYLTEDPTQRRIVVYDDRGRHS